MIATITGVEVRNGVAAVTYESPGISNGKGLYDAEDYRVVEEALGGRQNVVGQKIKVFGSANVLKPHIAFIGVERSEDGEWEVK